MIDILWQMLLGLPFLFHVLLIGALPVLTSPLSREIPQKGHEANRKLVDPIMVPGSSQLLPRQTSSQNAAFE